MKNKQMYRKLTHKQLASETHYSLSLAHTVSKALAFNIDSSRIVSGVVVATGNVNTPIDILTTITRAGRDD